jgi:ubiquinone/menaquinone biosynthesis C-methylase UbiE
MPTIYPRDENTYFIDAENAAEMARLTLQDRITTQAMGGLFPERSDFSSIEDILDIACGPGGWTLDVAFEHPDINVVGIDISQIMVGYAKAQARVQRLDNASFRVMDVLKPLDFPDNSFDLINSRFISAFMPPTAWPKLMEECVRVARPGGVIRLTESEWNLTNSLAYETLHSMTAQALKLAGRSFSPDGRNAGITPMLGSFLQQARCKNIQHAAYMIDFSAGTAAYNSLYQNSMVFFKLVEPFLLNMNVTSAEEFDVIYHRMLDELALDSFRGISFILSVWGETS